MNTPPHPIQTKQEIISKACTHTQIEIGSAKGPKAMDYICNDCGTAFSYAEKERIAEVHRTVPPWEKPEQNYSNTIGNIDYEVLEEIRY